METHSIFFLIPSALEEGARVSGSFQVVGNRSRALSLLFLGVEALVQSAIISLAFCICQTGFPSKK